MTQKPSVDDQIKTIPTPAPLPARRHRASEQPLIPVRMLNEHVYCPRLAYLEWVHKEWADNVHTRQGEYVHRRVDKPGGKLPDPSQEEDTDVPIAVHQRSVELSSPELGIAAKLDLAEYADGTVQPVDYKKSKRPHVAKQAYDPERVQLCAQGLLLEAHGYTTHGGFLYFAGSKERVHVEFDQPLRAQTKAAIKTLRHNALQEAVPPPLKDSPKCPKCSLVGICIPDEVNWLNNRSQTMRPISVADTPHAPVYVQAHSARVAKRGMRLEITVDDEPARHVRLNEVSQLVAMGNVYVTTPTIHELLRNNIPIAWHSFGGWFLGHTATFHQNNIDLRTAQYRASFDNARCLTVARSLVQAKIRNSRVLLRRNVKSRNERDEQALVDLKRMADRAGRAKSIDSLLGIEGSAAAAYFGTFNSMLSERGCGAAFQLNNRNRRPPLDPVNALLSFGYAMLTREITTSLSVVGFDVLRGLYHQPRHGKPALALDMMEPFRPLIVDSIVVTVLNTGEIQRDDFIETPVGVTLKDSGRKRFIRAFERRMAQEVTHPIFGYTLSYRRLFELQARLLARHLLDEIDEYPSFTTR